MNDYVTYLNDWSRGSDPFILAVKEAKRFIYLPFVILFVLCTARDLCVAYESAFHIERGEHNCSAVGLYLKSVRVFSRKHRRCEF